MGQQSSQPERYINSTNSDTAIPLPMPNEPDYSLDQQFDDEDHSLYMCDACQYV